MSSSSSASLVTVATTTSLSSSPHFLNVTTNTTNCGIYSEEDISLYSFWCDGVLVSIVATLGFAGNLLSLLVLSRPKLGDVFHHLLLVLACFDIIYIVCGGINYTFRAFRAESDVYTYLFPYFLYPMTHVALAGTIFMTLAISIERYLGLCHPMLPPQSRKAWFYVAPVVVVSFAINVPKFLEVELDGMEDEEGNFIPSYKSTMLRFDETYIRAYIMWTRLFSTAVIPVTLLLFLNARIVVDLCNSKVQRFGSARRQRKEINLCFILLSIVVIFFFCHAGRIILDTYEFTNVERIIECKPWIPEFWAQVLASISHLTMIANSSANFIVYCLVGHTFRNELCRTLGCSNGQNNSVVTGSMPLQAAANVDDALLGIVDNGNGEAVGGSLVCRMKSTLESNDKAIVSIENVREDSEEIKQCH